MMVPRPLRLVSVAHSYCVALNRRLAHEMAVAGAGKWEVTAVAPDRFHGELRTIVLEPSPGEACSLEPVPVRFSRKVQVMVYGSRLREILRSGWDLVHCWEEPYVLAGGQVARWTPEKSAFVFWTAQNLDKRYPPPFSWIERYCLERCDAWLACGHSIVEAMSRRGYGAKPHRVMPLGVDTQVFRPDPAAGRRARETLGWGEGGAPVIGYLGRFVTDKGLHLLTRALEETGPPWRALFVGGGPMEAELRAWGDRHPDRVRVVTGVRHDEVPRYLNAMSVLCAPSQTMPAWREQLGRMVLEAFACGVPVISSDSGELPHVVADAGIVVPEADVSAWSAAIARLLESPAQRTTLGARGVEHVRSGYSWPLIARRHLDFFSEILDDRTSRAV